MTKDTNETTPGENTRLQKWVDPAMYAATPVPDGGPRVFLLSATPDPLGSIAAAALLYEGTVVTGNDQVTHDQRQRYLAELQKTKIKAPLEFVQFHFLIEGVTRGFTHQLVRQRTATFVQESTRFAVKEDVQVGLPPSLVGTDWDSSELRRIWDDTTAGVRGSYNALVNAGMPAEDARGLLPTNLLTRIHYSTDLRALLDHAGNRLCTQAQFEWRIVFAKIAEAIRTYNPGRAQSRSVRNGDTELADSLLWAGGLDAWQWEALAALLQPICYATGKCEFNSSMDRACSIRDRVQANHSVNRPPSEWGERAELGMPSVRYMNDPRHGIPWVDEQRENTVIPSIDPREWLADPGAAR